LRPQAFIWYKQFTERSVASRAFYPNLSSLVRHLRKHR
jgi:hypothetical protein